MNRLKELREEKRLSQKEIAEALGVNEKTVSRWENGESTIKSDKAQALADYFGVSVGYLLGYEVNNKTDGLSDKIFNFQSEIIKNIRKMEYKEVVILEQISRDLYREAIIEQSRRYHVGVLFDKFPEEKNEI